MEFGMCRKELEENDDILRLIKKQAEISNTLPSTGPFYDTNLTMLDEFPQSNKKNRMIYE